LGGGRVVDSEVASHAVPLGFRLSDNAQDVTSLSSRHGFLGSTATNVRGYHPRQK
jgi:hypothetical protein